MFKLATKLMEAKGSARVVVTGAHPHVSSKLRESYAVIMNPNNPDVIIQRPDGMRSSESLQAMFKTLQYAPPAPLPSNEPLSYDEDGNLKASPRFERFG